MSDIVTKINSLNSSLAKINNERTKAIANKEAFSVNVVASLKKLKASTGVDLLADFEAGNTTKVGTALRELYGKEEKALSDKVDLATKLIEAFESGDYVKMNTLLGIEVHEPSLREQSGVDDRVADSNTDSEVLSETSEESSHDPAIPVEKFDFFADEETESEEASSSDVAGPHIEVEEKSVDDFFAPEESDTLSSDEPGALFDMDSTDDVFDPATIAEDDSPVEEESTQATASNDYDFDFDF